MPLELKERYRLQYTLNFELANIVCDVKYELPNSYLYSFKGKAIIGEVEIPITD